MLEYLDYSDWLLAMLKFIHNDNRNNLKDNNDWVLVVIFSTVKMGRPRKLDDKRECNQAAISNFFNKNQNKISESVEISSKRLRSPETAVVNNKSAKLDCQENARISEAQSSEVAEAGMENVSDTMDKISCAKSKLKENRNFQNSWKVSYPWLIYEKENQKIKCSICIKAGLSNSFVRGTNVKIDNIIKHLKATGKYNFVFFCLDNL